MIIISEDTALEMLIDRVNVWEQGKDNNDLYEEMYKNYVENGCFSSEDREFDPKIIVDNDIVNYTTIVKKGDDDFDKLLELYHNGQNDVSCEKFVYYGNLSYIEAVSDDEDRILVRY